MSGLTQAGFDRKNSCVLCESQLMMMEDKLANVQTKQNLQLE